MQCPGCGWPADIGRTIKPRCTWSVCFRRSLIDPCVYVHDEKQIIMESHGDDTLAAGTEASIEWFRDELRKGFECNVQPLVGVSDRLAKEAKFTKRISRCIPTEGWQFEGDPKHV